MDGVLILNRSPGRDTRGGQSFLNAKFAKVKKPDMQSSLLLIHLLSE